MSGLGPRSWGTFSRQWALKDEEGRPVGGGRGGEGEGLRQRERSQHRGLGTADPFPPGASLPSPFCLCSCFPAEAVSPYLILPPLPTD